MSPRLRSLRVLGALYVVCLASAGAAHAQTLAEAACRAAAIRALHGPPAKVYTTADLPPAAVLPPAPRVQARLPETAALEADLARERLLVELLRRRLEEQRPPSRREHRRRSERDADLQRKEDDRMAAPPGGIPLALAYGTPYVPFIGARGDGARGGHRGRAHGGMRPRTHLFRRDMKDRPAVPRDPRATPQRAPVQRNGYAESSRPFDYVAPGLPVRRPGP